MKEIQELRDRIRRLGVVGAGGAGFPTYVKMDEKVDTLILNCAECEPLLKLHRQLLSRRAQEILETLAEIARIVQAKQVVIGIKREYTSTVRELERWKEAFPQIRIHLLDGVYPMGDEIVLIYEATGRVVRPGGLPIEEGVAVLNVETVFNIYRALKEQEPVVEKLVSVVAEVKHPSTVSVPLGTSIREAVEMAGGATLKDPVYLVGGPMMGTVKTAEDVVTKTTNAILVLPREHYLIRKKESNPSIELKRAASICCQCQACTDLCPRHMLGHPITPHLFMRAASNQDFQDNHPFVNTLFCSSCGVCELYACPQELSPRTLMGIYKGGLRKSGVRPPVAEAEPVRAIREYRKLPEERLMARLDLTRYDTEAPLVEETGYQVKEVRIPLSQHIGAPAKVIVRPEEQVEKGQMIAKPDEGLSVGIHASISGRVVSVTETYVTIRSVG